MALWAVAYFAVALLPCLVIAWFLAPGLVQDFSAMMAQAQRAPATTADFAHTMALQARFMLLEVVFMPAAVTGRALLTAAIMRSVLRPEDSRYGYLRLGREELWLGLLIIVFGILAWISAFVLLIPTLLLNLALGYALRAAFGAAAAALISILSVIGYFGVLVWLAVRFSMAFPMTFSDREFRLFESWSVTKGHLRALLTLLLLALALVVNLVFWGVVVGMLVAGGNPASAMMAFFSQPPSVWVAQAAPWIVLGSIVMSFVAVFYDLILLAPWASAYRQLVAPPAAAAAPTTP